MADESPEPVFDAAVIGRLVEIFGGGAPAGQLIDTFLGEAPQLVETVAIGVVQNSLEEALRAAHTLKSSAAAVGALRLSAVSARVETLARSGQLDAVRGLVEQLRGALDDARELLSAEAVRLSGSAP